MAFQFHCFVLIVLIYWTEYLSVCSAEYTDGIKLANASSFVVFHDDDSSFEVFHLDGFQNPSKISTEDGSVSVSSAVVTFTGKFEDISESEYNSSTDSGTTFKWSNANFSKKEEVPSENRTQYAFTTALTTEEFSTFKYENVETTPTFTSDDLQNDNNNTVILKTLISTQQEQLQSNYTQTGSFYEISTLEESSTVTDQEGNVSNSSLDLQEPTLFSNNGQEKNVLMLLKSNCSLINSEKNITLNQKISDTSCTIYLRVNISSDNETQERLLRSLEKLSIKHYEFQLVEKHNQDEEEQSENKQHDKHYAFLLEPETFAYLAVAFAFAFLLLLAVIIFGLRCFKKRRPSLDISRFDVKLSNYTLTKIPRASLSSLDCLHESDCLDDKPESSTVKNKDKELCEPGRVLTSVDYESCHSSYEMFPSAMYSSNREMKTFGVTRANDSRNVDSKSDMIPQDNPVAYENHTFQRHL